MEAKLPEYEAVDNGVKLAMAWRLSGGGVRGRPFWISGRISLRPNNYCIASQCCKERVGISTSLKDLLKPMVNMSHALLGSQA